MGRINFSGVETITEILHRKLVVVKKKCRKSPMDYEKIPYSLQRAFMVLNSSGNRRCLSSAHVWNLGLGIPIGI
ncbi:hypothetical protein ATC1_1250 [Flexilinea flocculi]|uniref:Uncharacterized protein n=1 Tax=Flexilinea flocculi TaxID=1678840 RepID=A0A0K8PBJ7_9CHLR|nr:hypothetical protein ATC1_1250 [Flexilinea flocculi]